MRCATSVLAHSWRDLWRSAPAARIAGSKGWAGGIDAFRAFVDGLLDHRRRDAPLDSCDFDLEVDPADVPAIDRDGNIWIRRALRRHVRELRFRLDTTNPRLPFTLSDQPFSSQLLARLELFGVEGNAGVLDFSRCPALEELKMEGCSVGSLDMRSPSLKHLSIKYCIFYSNYRTCLSFPSLVSFKFMTNVGRAPLLESMPSLARAKVRFDHYFDDKCRNGRLDDDCGDGACNGCHYYYGPDDYDCVFLEGLTEASHLYLDLKWCPTFSKLKTLVLHKWFVTADFRALTWFLHNTPLLENLILIPSKVPDNLIKTEGSYKPSGQSLASGHLKLVTVICKEVDQIVLNILKILNANGIHLEKISIKCSGGELSMSPHNYICAVANM
ncbi:hypothetical protein EJB05_29231, partial [Eragrostis curvula]